MAKPNPKYDLIISLAKSKFTSQDIIELTLDSITNKGEIKYRALVHKLSEEDIVNLGEHLRLSEVYMDEATRYLFPSKSKGQTSEKNLIRGLDAALKIKNMTLADIGWKATATRRVKLNTLEDILAFAKRVKEKGTTN